MSWRFPGISPVRPVAHMSRSVCAFLLAVPLALLALAPLAGPAGAHPAYANTPSTGKTASPAVDLTLHYHSTLSGIYQPTNLATDAQGNLYVSESGANPVRMYDPNDVFVRAFGSGTAGTGNGNLDTPEGVAVSGTTVFVVDNANHQIQSFNQSTGAFISEFGSADLANPDGLALGANGTLYVVDRDQNRIVEFSTGGSYLGSFGTAGSGNGQFNLPSHIAASRFGALYVTDAANNRVQEFTLDGSYITQWGHASFKAPLGLAVDRAGMVYVADETARTVYKFDPGGSLVGSYTTPITAPLVPGDFVEPSEVAVRSIPNTPLAVYVADESVGVERFDQVLNPQLHTYQAQWGNGGSSNGQFNVPVAAAVDSAGDVYVTDYNNNRVEKFDQFGTFMLAFGGLGNGNGQLFEPTGVTISADGGTIFVVDQGNSRIEEFSPSGGYLGQFGQSGSGEGQFHLSQGIAIDGIYLFVADAGNNRIEVFNTSGVYQWQFGSAGSGPTQFNFPRGVAVDINRNELFIADSGNNRVEVYTTGGQQLSAITAAGGVNLNDPFAVNTDPRGDVYVADSLNNRIVETDVTTTHTTAFGVGGSGNGQFATPWGVAVSPINGQLYIVDTGNNRIQRFGSPWPKNDTVGIYRPSTKTFYLRTANSTGPAEITVPMPYAQSGDIPVVGDWNGDGVDTVGLYRPSKARFLLQDANVEESAPDYTFTLGIPGDTPIAGDWNGQGSDGAGIFRPSSGILYLKNSLGTGVSDENLVLGVPGDEGIAGDWNGDGQDSPGVYRPSNQTFYVTNKVTDGVVYADAAATLGTSGDVPFTGDWPAQGSSGIGVFRPSNGVTYEKNQVSTGFADTNFIYGVAGDIPVAGQWVAPSVPFSAPAPHVSLGTPSSSATTPAASGGWLVTLAPSHTVSGEQTPATTPRRAMPR